MRSGLTLESIRAGLRTGGTAPFAASTTQGSGSPPSSPLENQDSSESPGQSTGQLSDRISPLGYQTFEPLSSSRGATLAHKFTGSGPSGSFADEQLPTLLSDEPKGSQLFDFCHNLLAFGGRLDVQRSESLEESNGLRQAVRQLETLLDSIRERELPFGEQVQEQQRKFEARESKYLNLKKRALQHITEWQEERDRYAAELTVIESRISDFEADLAEFRRHTMMQRDEISSLKELTKTMPSEKEITSVNVKLRSLQNENAKLMTDKTTLQKVIDELNAKIQKKLQGASAAPEFLSAMFGTSYGLGASRAPFRNSKFDLDHSHSNKLSAEGGSGSGDKCAKLSKTAMELQEKIDQQADAFKIALEDAKSKKDQFLEYVHYLDEELRKSKGGKSSDEDINFAN